MRDGILEFTKMSAGGNDFLVVDRFPGGPGGARQAVIDADFVRRVCRRALSVGGDGLILIEPCEKADVRMIYYNADGGRAALCGNGVRCVARLASLRGHARAAGMTIEADCGILPAEVAGDVAGFSLSLGRPALRSMTLHVDGVPGGLTATLLTVGVPHLVVPHADAHGMTAEQLAQLAPQLRRHPDLGPEGANVDFVTVRGPHGLDIRCWERGIEGETLSSGSGCIASALASIRAGQAESPVACRSRTGLVSTVTLRTGPDEILAAHLAGDARVIYEGRLDPEALAGFVP